jgi:uncharacterized protein YeaC (DUF1315 family)
MDLKALLDSITPEVYERLKQAVEIGKWPDGRALTDGQKALSLQAVIAYEDCKPAEQRSGYVPPKVTPCEPSPAEEAPIKWTQ